MWYLGIIVLLTLYSATLVLAVDSGETGITNPPPPDKLQEILSRGNLVMVINPDISPDFAIINGTERDPASTCTDEQYSQNQVSGEKVEIASKIAEELGVDSCIVTADDDEIQGGNWSGKWDYYLGYYMTNERMKWLYFSQPVKASPSVFFIRSDNKNITSLEDLSGKRIGTFTTSAQADYLKNIINIPGNVTKNLIKDPKIVEYRLQNEAFDDLVSGKLDAVLLPLIALKEESFNGTPITHLMPYAFTGYSGPAIERSNSTDSVPFVKKMNDIILKLHAEGVLSNISMKYNKIDITKEAGEFNISSLNQFHES